MQSDKYYHQKTKKETRMEPPFGSDILRPYHPNVNNTSGQEAVQRRTTVKVNLTSIAKYYIETLNAVNTDDKTRIYVEVYNSSIPADTLFRLEYLNSVWLEDVEYITNG